MPQEVRGVIARAKGEPVTVETIVIPDPGPGEVRVRVHAVAICHSDVSYADGEWGGDIFPGGATGEPLISYPDGPYSGEFRIGHADNLVNFSPRNLEDSQP